MTPETKSYSSPEEKRFFESNKWPTSFWTQYKTLTHRNFVEAKGQVVSKYVFAGVRCSSLLRDFHGLRMQRM